MRGMIVRQNAKACATQSHHIRICIGLLLIALPAGLVRASVEDATKSNQSPDSAYESCSHPYKKMGLICGDPSKLIFLCESGPDLGPEPEKYRIWSEGFAPKINRSDWADLDDVFHIEVATGTIRVTHMIWRIKGGKRSYNGGNRVPLWTYTVSCQSGMSRAQCLFSPIPSQESIEAVDRANKLAGTKAQYPEINESVPNELLFAALSGSADAKRLLLERGDEFPLDGALGEEWGKSQATLKRYQELGCIK